MLGSILNASTRIFQKASEINGFGLQKVGLKYTSRGL
jgi:hypothetical protein